MAENNSNKLEKFIKFIPTWQTLESIGNNKLIKSTYIWIVIIPILAKLLEKIPMNSEIIFGNIHISLTLPFSWQLLYFSALIFAIATALFSLFCPPLISKFSDIQEYKKKGLDKEQLITYFSAWLRKNHSTHDSNGKEMKKESFYNLFCKKYTVNLDTDKIAILKKNKTPIHKKIKHYEIKDDEFLNAFWFLRNAMVNDSLSLRVTISIFYFIGFLILFKLLTDNILAVIIMS